MNDFIQWIILILNFAVNSIKMNIWNVYTLIHFRLNGNGCFNFLHGWFFISFQTRNESYRNWHQLIFQFSTEIVSHLLDILKWIYLISFDESNGYLFHRHLRPSGINFIWYLAKIKFITWYVEWNVVISQKKEKENKYQAFLCHPMLRYLP